MKHFIVSLSLKFYQQIIQKTLNIILRPMKSNKATKLTYVLIKLGKRIVNNDKIDILFHKKIDRNFVTLYSSFG